MPKQPNIKHGLRAFYLPEAPPTSVGASFFFFLAGARIVPVAKREVADVITLPMLERIFAQINRACGTEHISRSCTKAYRASKLRRPNHLLCVKLEVLLSACDCIFAFESKMFFRGLPAFDGRVFPVRTDLGGVPNLHPHTVKRDEKDHGYPFGLARTVCDLPAAATKRNSSNSVSLSFGTHPHSSRKQSQHESNATWHL